MIVKRCIKCGKLVWWFQDSGSITFALKSGGEKKVNLCIDCGIKIMNRAIELEEPRHE
jgi:DNA-directed RNA polymerase subunit RPC12/RpoP